MYLMLGTRSDLVYSVGFLSKSLENPTTEDVARVKKVFRYIAGIIDLDIIYQCNASKGILKCFSYTDFGECIKTGRSTLGVHICLDNSAAVKLAQNLEFYRRTRHIATKHFFIRKEVTERELKIQQISIKKLVADIMTKPLIRTGLKMCDQMGLL
ncbi:hypothetical protein ACFW04_014005 [Cataglyphis niger]